MGGVIPQKHYQFLNDVGVSQIYGHGAQLPLAVDDMLKELNLQLLLLE